MDDSNKQICRLCLEITPPCECETVKEIRKEILEVLPININLDISDYAVVCNTCLESLHDYCDFKSQCINTFMDVDIKVDIKKEVFQCELINNESICRENRQVCRFCMSLFEVEPLSYIADLKDEVLLKDVIRNCLPDSNLNAVHESLVCKQCLSSITRYYEFLKSCQEVEQRIERFCQARGYSTIDRVNLKDMLTFKDSDMPVNPTIIQKECPEVEFIDVNVMNCLKSEETVNIKCEEVDIKDELDNGVKMGEFDQSQNNDNSGKFSKRSIRNSESKGKTHFCPKCPYSAKTNSRIKRHMHSHSANKVRRCTLCGFIADATLSLTAHLASHRGPTKAFGCHECPYETDHGSILERHLRKHKDKSELEMYKCLLCPYESKYKSALSQHQMLKHDKNIKMYSCKECSFNTKHKVSLTRHLLLHKSPEEIPKYKCEQCEYVSVASSNVRKHMVIHSDERPFSCNQCSYCTNRKGNMLKHERIHPSNGEREMYKCNICSYESKTDITLKAHMAKIHKDPTVPNMKCAHCSYETTVKIHMSRHMRQWHSSRDQPTLTCALCPYTTTEKDNLYKHSFVHQETNLQCDQCDFQTKRKGNLQAHMHVHDPSRQLTFKCDQCEYCTRQKSDLRKHQLKHMGLEEVTIYYCATCEFKSKYKRSLNKHVKRCLKSTSTMEKVDKK